jgi:hypothetical protein
VAKTLVLNVSEGAATLPAPYVGVLASQGQGVIDDIPANVEAVLAASAAGGLGTVFKTREVTDGETTTIGVGAVANASVSPAYTAGGDDVVIPIDIPDAVTTTYTYVAQFKMEIFEVSLIKDVAGAGNTVQVQDGAAAAITDAMAAAVDKTVTRAATIDKAKRVIAKGAQFKILASKSAGSMACQVFLRVIRRA